MHLRPFVSGSAVLLIGWLVVTFVYEMPSQRYPKLDPSSKTMGPAGQNSPEAPATTQESAIVRISDSH